jgi:hypothetical protein
MGIVAARRLGICGSRKFSDACLRFVAARNAALAIPLAYALDYRQGRVLCHYFVRQRFVYSGSGGDATIDPGSESELFVPMSLAITFPFNIIAGMPIYLAIINYFWR